MKHPVPLRTAQQPWGRTDLTPKEHRQVRTANVLLTYTIAFATLSLMYGIGAWIEHPGLLPKHATLGAPSIWNFKQVQRLVAAPCVRRLQVNHSDFGGLAVKPTGILAIRLDTLEKRFKDNKHTVPRQGQFKGTDKITGAWKTAVAKEYPTRLSASLARAMIDQLLLHTTAYHYTKAQFDPQLLHQFMPPHDP